MAARARGRVARRAPLLSLPPTKGLSRGPQKLDKVLRQQTAPVPSVPSVPTTQITPDPTKSRIPIYKQHLSQVSQLPRQPQIPQPTRIPAHKQHLSQVSQVSQLPPQRRPQPPPPHPVNWLGHGKAPTSSQRTHNIAFPSALFLAEKYILTPMRRSS